MKALVNFGEKKVGMRIGISYKGRNWEEQKAAEVSEVE